MITVKVDVRKELARFKRFGPEGRRHEMEFMKRHGRALISSSGSTPGIVQLTPPHSQGVRGQKAKVQGEAAVSADINKVYGSPGKLYDLIRKTNKGAAAGFWIAVKAKDWARANQIAHSLGLQGLREFDDGAAHDSRRNNRGRVSGRNPSIYIAQKSQSIDKPGAWVSAYIKQKKALVGLLAAALISSSTKKLGRLAGVPGWVDRHKSKAASMAGVFITENGAEIIITANIYSTRAPAKMQTLMDYAVQYRLTAMKADLPRTALRMEKELQKGL